MLIYTGICSYIYNKIYTSRFSTTRAIELSKNFCTIWRYNHNITLFLKTAFINKWLTSWWYNCWWPLMAPFVDRVELTQACRATLGLVFTFTHQVRKRSWYSFDQPPKDKRLNRYRCNLVVSNLGSLVWWASALKSSWSTNDRTLTHILPMLHFCTPWKRHSFLYPLTFSGGTEM